LINIDSLQLTLVLNLYFIAISINPQNIEEGLKTQIILGAFARARTLINLKYFVTRFLPSQRYPYPYCLCIQNVVGHNFFKYSNFSSDEYINYTIPQTLYYRRICAIKQT